MSTTFAELSQLSANLAAVGAVRLAPNISATLDATSAVGPNGLQTMGLISGGVTFQAAAAVLAPVSALTLNLKVRKPIQATLAASADMPFPVGAIGSLSGLVGFASNKVTGSSVGILSALTSSSSGAFPVPVFSIADTVFVPILSVATGLTGEIADADVSLAPLASFASNKPYGGVYAVMPGFTGSANDIFGIIGPIAIQLYEVADRYSVGIDYGVSIDGSFTTTDTYALAREVLMSIAESISTNGVINTLVEYGLEMSETIELIDGILKNADQIVWVVNTDTGANWTYRGWDFNSYMTWQGKYYAAAEDGFYELVGDTDAGEPIVSSILTGNSDLGTVQQKRMAYVYVGANADSGLSLVVHTDDGQTNEYTISARELMQNSRTSIGKGLRSKYWQFEITNPDGGDFELESLELIPDALIRRI